jgi:hypothetical protein
MQYSDAKALYAEQLDAAYAQIRKILVDEEVGNDLYSELVKANEEFGYARRRLLALNCVKGEYDRAVRS